MQPKINNSGASLVEYALLLSMLLGIMLIATNLGESLRTIYCQASSGFKSTYKFDNINIIWSKDLACCALETESRVCGPRTFPGSCAKPSACLSEL